MQLPTDTGRSVAMLVAISLLITVSQPAQAWIAFNRQTVTPLTAQSFEVLGQSGSSSVDYWCAAGDYARRVLDAPLGQRIYVTRARGPAETANRRSAVQFSPHPARWSRTTQELAAACGSCRR